MSRTFVYQTLVTDANSGDPESLGGVGITPASIYASGVDTPRGDTFLVVRFGSVGRGQSVSFRGEFTIWVYDKNNDYLRIDRIIKRCRYLLESIEAQKTLEGWITSISWSGSSDDLHDDVYRAHVRNAAFAIVSSGR